MHGATLRSVQAQSIKSVIVATSEVGSCFGFQTFSHFCIMSSATDSTKKPQCLLSTWRSAHSRNDKVGLMGGVAAERDSVSALHLSASTKRTCAKSGPTMYVLL